MCGCTANRVALSGFAIRTFVLGFGSSNRTRLLNSACGPLQKFQGFVVCRKVANLACEVREDLLSGAVETVSRVVLKLIRPFPAARCSQSVVLPSRCRYEFLYLHPYEESIRALICMLR